MSQISEPFICSTDYGYEDDPEPLTWDNARNIVDALSEMAGDWQGIPVPIGNGQSIRLHDRHPMRQFFRSLDDESGATGLEPGEELVNQWYSHKTQAEVYVLRKDGKSFALKFPRSPDQSMDRLTFWLGTMGAHQAWTLDAEYTAREKLRGLLSDHQWRMYDLTGVFLELSPRSKVMYMFRRLRPTVALTPRWPDGQQIDTMRCLAVLCLHPVGYYAGTWAGCMTPTDDVIAHLLMVRADEAGYWAKANQHDPSSPEAGL
jgi:hypothetical protein